MEKQSSVGRMEITTVIGCKIQCANCPQNLLCKRYLEIGEKSKPTIMSFETFKACVDKLPTGTRIDFSGMAEPWLNKECTNMVLYAAQKGFPLAIYTTLVGMSLSDFDKIKELEFIEFVLHIPDDNNSVNIPTTEQYLELLKTVIEYKTNGESIVTGFSCHGGVHKDIIEAIPTDARLITELIDRAGNVDTNYVEHQTHKGEVACVNCGNCMNHNVLLPDGSVVLCCMDYGLRHILGNLLNQSYEEVYNSNESKKIREGLKDNSLDTLCRSCSNAKNAQEIYSEFALFRDWTGNLLKQQKQTHKDISSYKEWVENLTKQIEEQSKQIEEQKTNISDYCDDNIRLKNCIAKLTTDWNDKNAELVCLDAELQDMKQSKAYKRYMKKKGQ